MAYRFTLRLAGVAAALLAALPAWGQPKVTAVVGWDGQAKYAHWNPVFVTVDNPGQPVRGALRVQMPAPARGGGGGASYLRPVNLPTNSRQRHVIYVHLPLRAQMAPLAVELLEGRRRVARVESGATYRLSGDDQLVAVIGREVGSLNFLAAAGAGRAARATRVAYPEPDLLPDRPQGYDAVDVLVLGDVPARIPRRSLEAIRQWVAMGGTLVVSGGPNVTRLREPALAGLLPVRVTGSRALDRLSALGSWYGTAVEAGGVVVAEGTALSGSRVLLAQRGIPLIVTRDLGLGRVIYLAFDFEAFPVKGWVGQQAMWEDLLWQPGAAVPRPREDAARAVMAIGQTEVPPFWLIGIFLIGYPVVLVPVNYLWLKRRRRLEWAWLTLPVIVVFFSLAAYGVGYALRGGYRLLSRAAIVQGRAGTGEARATLIMGLFSPRKSRYRISADAAPMFELAEPRAGGGGRPAMVTETDDDVTVAAEIDMWAMRVFRADRPLDLGKGIEADLRYANGAVQGRLANRTPYDLADCFLLLGDREESIGALPGGKTVTVRFAAKPQARPPYSWSPGRTYRRYSGGDEAQLRQRMRDELRDALGLRGSGQGPRDPSALLLVGWSDDALLPLSVRPPADRTHDLDCFVIALPYRWAPVAGRVVIPPGAVGAVEGPEASAAAFPDPRYGGVRMSGGEVEYAFRLPEGAGVVELDTVEVAYHLTGGGGAEVLAWDWRKGAWQRVAQAPAANPATGMFDLAGGKSLPASRYARRGLVRIRITHDAKRAGRGLSIQSVDVGFSGRAP